MAAKSTSSLRDRRLPPSSSARLSSASPPGGQKAPLSDAANPSPIAKIGVPTYLKSKAALSSELSPRISSCVISTTISAASRTSSARRLAEKQHMPSNHTALQRSSKPASPTRKPSSYSRPNGDKADQPVSRSSKTSSVPKAKSAISAPVKKKVTSLSVDSPSLQIKLPDNKAVNVNEKPVHPQTINNCKHVVGSLAQLDNEEEIKFIRSLIEEGHNEKCEDGEAEDREVLLEHQVVNDTPKETVVVLEVPEEVPVVVVASTLEKSAEENKAELVESRVEPELIKSKLGAAISSATATTKVVEKKDVPRSNDVIEVTKSKLMGTRRNRVLALVGAFETVISLQDPEGQPTQKTYQNRHCLQYQQVEKSLQSQKQQEAQAAHEGQQIKGNDQPQVIGEVKENATVKEEEASEALRRGEEGEDELQYEEEDVEALEIGAVEEDALDK